MMEKQVSPFYEPAKQIWNTAAKTDSEYSKELEIQLDQHKRLLNLINVGNHYHLVFNIFLGEVESINNCVTDVLGYEPEEMTASFFYIISIRKTKVIS